MSKITYLTDSISLKKMQNFWNHDMSSQNHSENLREWIGGEYYIQTSLYEDIKDNENFSIICIDKPFNEAILTNSKFIIAPGWREIPATYQKYADKIFSYFYYAGKGNSSIKQKNIFTPYKYIGENHFLPITKIREPKNLKPKMDFSKFNINGLLIGKCISHVVSGHHEDKLLNLLDRLDTRLFSTLRPLHNIDNLRNTYCERHRHISELMYSHNKLCHLGIIDPIEFRYLLKHVKYCLFYYTARFSPTIIESLCSNCIVLSNKNIIPKDIANSKNVFLLDDMSVDDILVLIKKIENNEILFKNDSIQKEYSSINKINILNNFVMELS